MEYLTSLLGITVKSMETDIDGYLSHAITRRYRIEGKILGDLEVLFIYPKGELESVDAIEAHITSIRKVNDIPVVLILEKMSYRYRERLLKRNIPFVVEGRQIYLPFLGTYLQSRCDDTVAISADELAPAAQVLFLYLVHKGEREVSSTRAASDLGFTPTTIMRALNQLEQFSLIRTERRGVNRFALMDDESPRMLFEKALGFLQNPVKRVVYISKDDVDDSLLVSGETLLSEMSMLGKPFVDSYATSEITRWSSIGYPELTDCRKEVAVELWRYDPRKLSSDSKHVDRLSLALSFKESSDERVSLSVEEMLDEFWRGSKWS